jgi:hypothetical protein
MKKLFSLLLSAVLLLSALTGALTSCSEVTDPNETKYTAALGLIASGDYESAYAAFKELGNYKDSETYLSRFMYFPSVTHYVLHDRSGVMTTTLGSYNLPVRLLTKGTIDGEGEYTKDGWYSYDNKGNWMRQAMLYNSDFMAYDYTYDANGNIIKAYCIFVGKEICIINLTFLVIPGSIYKVPLAVIHLNIVPHMRTVCITADANAGNL